MSVDAPPAGPRHHPATVAAALALPVALAAGIIAAAVISQHGQSANDTGPVVLAAVDAPAASSPACTALLHSLPQVLGDAARAELAPPAPIGAAAWRVKDSEIALTLRCGVDRPAEFDQAAALVVVNGVQWLQLAGTGATTWVAVDRSVYLALTLPEQGESAALQDASNVVKTALPAQALNPAPVR